MFNLLHVINLGAAADDAPAIAAQLGEAGKALLGVVTCVAGATLPHAFNGAHILWRIGFATEHDHWAALSSARWRETIEPHFDRARGVTFDRIAYRSHCSDTTKRQQTNAVWRCLVLSVDAGTAAGDIAQFEKDLMVMPDHVPAIRSWALARVSASTGRRNWTHVWEQEFDDIAGLEVDYMLAPVHWGLVDGWFDPECPQRIVDPFLIHAAIPIDGAAIA